MSLILNMMTEILICEADFQWTIAVVNLNWKQRLLITSLQLCPRREVHEFILIILNYDLALYQNINVIVFHCKLATVIYLLYYTKIYYTKLQTNVTEFAFVGLPLDIQ